jgi:Ferredoxin-like domain in Api92-like protein
MINTVQITGPADEVARFRVTHICLDRDGKDVLDFNSIIPMPSELKHTESRVDIDVLVWALGGELHAERDPFRLGSGDDTPFDRPWVRNLGVSTREELLRWAEMERTDDLDAARRLLEIERSTGHRSWYGWQVENWGCKWGCCGFAWQSDAKTAFCMHTPWSAPVPIFEKLAELYPSLTFACHFVEPNMGIDVVETYTAEAWQAAVPLPW